MDVDVLFRESLSEIFDIGKGHCYINSKSEKTRRRRLTSIPVFSIQPSLNDANGTDEMSYLRHTLIAPKEGHKKKKKVTPRSCDYLIMYYQWSCVGICGMH